MANTEDLRYVRTEALIRDAFMGLVAERPVASVTAVEVCRHAGISRNAFYLHYPSVPALYAALVEGLVEDIRRECLASAERVAATGNVDEAFASSVLETLAKHEALLRALLPSDDGSLVKRLAEGLEDVYVEAGESVSESGSSFEHRLSCAFAAWAHVGFVSRWIAGNELPLAQSQQVFESLQIGISGLATRFLTGDESAYEAVS